MEKKSGNPVSNTVLSNFLVKIELCWSLIFLVYVKQGLQQTHYINLRGCKLQRGQKGAVSSTGAIGAMRPLFETFSRYSRVDDEEQKTGLCILKGSLLKNLV